MTTFLVSYDLRAPGRGYHDLIDEIKASPTLGWAKPLESCFLVVTRESAGTLFTRLRAKTDENDSILVIRVCKPYQAWTSQNVHDWIGENVPSCQ